MFAFRLPTLAVVVAVVLALLPAVAVPPRPAGKRVAPLINDPILVRAERPVQGNPERLEVPLKRGGKLVLEFARIPKGTFMMGSPQSERDAIFKKYEAIVKKYNLPASFFDDEKEHEVEITHDYYMAKTTVTRGQFRAFVEEEDYKPESERDGKGGWGWTGGTTWEQKPEFSWKNPGFAQTDEHPVVNVSWNDATAYCAWVARKTGKAVRLPTEAEWERACRGGERKGQYFFGDDEEELARFANVADASFRAATKGDWNIKADDGHAFTAPVRSYRPNQYGLYDMHGNVWQWCSDWYDKDYYAKSAKRDPGGPNSGSHRVFRGGSWGGIAVDARAADRGRTPPFVGLSGMGFRLALVPSEPR